MGRVGFTARPNDVARSSWVTRALIKVEAPFHFLAQLEEHPGQSVMGPRVPKFRQSSFHSRQSLRKQANEAQSDGRNRGQKFRKRLLRDDRHQRIFEATAFTPQTQLRIPPEMLALHPKLFLYVRLGCHDWHSQCETPFQSSKTGKLAPCGSADGFDLDGFLAPDELEVEH